MYFDVLFLSVFKGFPYVYINQSSGIFTSFSIAFFTYSKRIPIKNESHKKDFQAGTREWTQMYDYEPNKYRRVIYLVVTRPVIE